MRFLFKKIAILGKCHSKESIKAILSIYNFLLKNDLEVFLSAQILEEIDIKDQIGYSILDLGSFADLVIVIGGDGNMLNAARILSQYDVYVLGVNLGKLGFLTDLAPKSFVKPLIEILSGNYYLDERFLLTGHKQKKEKKQEIRAVNEIVLNSGKIAHMIEFEVYINSIYAYHQRSDGIIIATPTGSTAYSLSGGGPIIHSKMDAILLFPMFAHTLSARPLIVDANSVITLVIGKAFEHKITLSADSQNSFAVKPGDTIEIKKYSHKFKLIHPKNYDYFQVLREKLNWGNKIC